MTVNPLGRRRFRVDAGRGQFNTERRAREFRRRESAGHPRFVILDILAGILVAIVVGVAVLILLIPFGVLGALGFFLLTMAEPFGIGLLVVVGLLFGLSVLLVIALAQAPVVAYLRYYALLVLGEIETELDLIPEQRAAVRADEG